MNEGLLAITLHPLWKELQEAATNTAIEESVARNVRNDVLKIANSYNQEMADETTVASLSLMAYQAAKNGWCKPEHKAIVETMAYALAKSVSKDITNTVTTYFVSNNKVKNLVSDYTKMGGTAGELAGVTDPSVILNTVAATYATVAADRSRYNDFVFNTQGGSASATVELDLSKVALLERAKLSVELELNEGKTKRVYIDDKVKLYRGKPRRTPAIRQPVWTPFRKELHKKITDYLDREIIPQLMDMAGKGEHEPNWVSVYELGCNGDNYRYNMQLAPPTEQVVANVPKPAAKKTTPATPPSTPERYPVTKEMCKLGDGNYRCPVCGKDKLSKNKLMLFTPRNLPTGMPADDPSLTRSQQWAMSNMCGACSASLKEERDKATGGWVRAQREANTIPAELEEEYTNYLKYYEEAVNLAAEKEKHLSTTEESIAVLKNAGIDVPESLVTLVETHKFNVQQAHAAMTTMEAKVKDVEQKIAAIKKGQATPVKELVTVPEKPAVNNTQASPSKAVVISIPVGTKASRKEKKKMARR